MWQSNSFKMSETQEATELSRAKQAIVDILIQCELEDLKLETKNYPKITKAGLILAEGNFHPLGKEEFYIDEPKSNGYGTILYFLVAKRCSPLRLISIGPRSNSSKALWQRFIRNGLAKKEILKKLKPKEILKKPLQKFKNAYANLPRARFCAGQNDRQKLLI